MEMFIDSKARTKKIRILFGIGVGIVDKLQVIVTTCTAWEQFPPLTFFS